MPVTQKLMDHLYIKVDGSDLPAQIMDDLLEATVETSLRLPHMFTIQIHDEQLKWIDDGPFALGKSVEIAAVHEQSGASHVLIKGEITAIEPDFGEGTQALLTVRGYDRSHRLHRGTVSKAYQQVTDSDLATRIAQGAGLSAKVDSTSEVYAHVLQHNQTPMEFLAERARRIGYEFYVDDKTLHFHKPVATGDTLALEWGQELKSFSPRLTLVQQVDEVVVKGWDSKTRQVVVGRATQGTAEPQTGYRQSGARFASAAFSGAKRAMVDCHVSSQGEATTLAQAVLDEISGAFIEAEGVAFGLPELRAGKFVKLGALGRQFSGTYFVTAATHIYRADAGYSTSFSIHGRRPATLHSLIEGRTPSKNDSAWIGPAVAVVTNNKDPEGRGRVKVKFPTLSDEVESDWARIVSAGAGPDRGFYCLPEINDEVLVGFESGDPGRPYVLGGLWNGQDKPPLAIEKALANGKVNRRIFQTRAGHKLTFVDDAEKSVVLETSGGHRLTMADEKKKVMLETSGGQTLTLDDSKNEVTLKSSANMTLKSGADLMLEATGSLTLKGQTFSLSANGTGEVKANATLTVQGSLVKIN